MTLLSSQGCRAVSIDTCTALARLLVIFWGYTRLRVAHPRVFQNPPPAPVETRTPRCGYGLTRVGVRVALENPRVTRANPYPPALFGVICDGRPGLHYESLVGSMIWGKDLSTARRVLYAWSVFEREGECPLYPKKEASLTHRSRSGNDTTYQQWIKLPRRYL